MNTLRVFLSGLAIALSASPLAAVSISQFNVSATENFDSLAQVTSSVVPAGWALLESGSGANTTYGASPGTSSTGNTYSFGATGSSDRAFGSLRTTSVAATIGTLVTNDTGGTITNLTIQFTGEQWRLGALGRVDRFDFGYSLDATSLADGSWLDVDTLDFIAPVTAGSVGALDGNAVENQTLMTHSITGLSLAPGASLWLRWVDFEASGSDDGLAIDNFAISSISIDTPPVHSVPDNLPFGFIAVFFGMLLAVESVWRKAEANSESFGGPRGRRPGTAGVPPAMD